MDRQGRRLVTDRLGQAAQLEIAIRQQSPRLRISLPLPQFLKVAVEPGRFLQQFRPQFLELLVLEQASSLIAGDPSRATSN